MVGYLEMATYPLVAVITNKHWRIPVFAIGDNTNSGEPKYLTTDIGIFHFVFYLYRNFGDEKFIYSSYSINFNGIVYKTDSADRSTQ